MEAKAIGKHVRVTPRKLRLVAGQIKKNGVSEALTKLKFINKSAAPHIAKVVKSAAANATKNFGADADALFIKEIRIDHGPTLKYAKRFIPRAQGRASGIKKRSAHIVVVVSDSKK
ncbi:MAG TPA: 50S ribosomal protein L22 [bacterium]|nr:50S ribosomal protein L22 [bacterium]